MKYLSTDSVTRKVIELAEAGQRLRFGDSLTRVVPDLALDWLGARYHTKGFAQIVRSTDAGGAFQEAVMSTLEKADGQNAIGRLEARGPDLAGRGEAWLLAAVDHVDAEIAYTSGDSSVGLATSTLDQGAGFSGEAGSWLIARPITEGDLLTWDLSDATGLVTLATLQLGDQGEGTQVSWSVEVPVEGACYTLVADEAGPRHPDCRSQLRWDRRQRRRGGHLGRHRVRPEVLAVVQDISARVGRPESMPKRDLRELRDRCRCPSKPMTQETVDKPTSYVLSRGDHANIKVQPGGRVALMNLKSAVGTFTLEQRLDLTDPRKPTRGLGITVQTLAGDGVSITGTVRRANGTLATNVPVTLTAYDLIAGIIDCEQFTVRVSQTFTDDEGKFAFDFVLADVPYSVSATDTFGLDAETIQLVVNAMSGDAVSRSKLYTIAEQPVLDSLFQVFDVNSVDAALDAIQGLDRPSFMTRYLWIHRGSARRSPWPCDSGVAARFTARSGTLTERPLLGPP